MDRELAGWGIIFDTATGAMVSRATVVADPLPDGLALVERPADFDPEAERWDDLNRQAKPWTNQAKADALRDQAAALDAEANKIAP